MAIFDNEPDPADIEQAYIDRVIPEEAAELWNNSIESSAAWELYSPEDHMFLADMFADAVFNANLNLAEEWTEYLEIDWDNEDIHSFYEAYEALTG